MADMNSTPQAGELLFLSLQRAKFLETLAADRTPALLSTEDMFLLGLFSFLDAILGQSMGDILAKLTLEPRLAAALVGRDEDLRAWLDLATAYERGHWDQAGTLLTRLALSPEQTAKIFNDSALWAKQFLGAAGGSRPAAPAAYSHCKA